MIAGAAKVTVVRRAFLGTVRLTDRTIQIQNQFANRLTFLDAINPFARQVRKSVDDHARGIDTALRKGEFGSVYNVAGDNERENIFLTNRLLELLGKDDSSIQLVKDRPGHDFRYSIDARKLHGLGWKPEMNWDEGIEKTVNWYRDNEEWWRPIKSGEFKDYYERQYANREV